MHKGEDVKGAVDSYEVSQAEGVNSTCKFN